MTTEYSYEQMHEALKLMRDLRKAGKIDEASAICRVYWPHLHRHFYEGEERKA